jgi:CheY-like chemotaxis protein
MSNQNSFHREIESLRARLRALETEAGAAPLPITTPIFSQVLGGAHVLVVDDIQDAREMLRLFLTMRGARVTCTGSALEAMQALEQDPPDILVADISMPQFDGYQLIRTLRARERERGGHLPAIAVTGYTQEKHRVRALSDTGFERFRKATRFTCPSPSSRTPSSRSS